MSYIAAFYPKSHKYTISTPTWLQVAISHWNSHIFPKSSDSIRGSCQSSSYADHSIFVRADWDNSEYTKDKTGMTAEDVAKLIQGQLRYILHDPHISKGRKMLMIEQFRNAELAELQTKQNYRDVLNYFMGMMRFLIREGTLKDEDPEIMAAQFSSPITVWINLCDREPEREDEVMDLVRKHVMQFFKIYRK